MTGPEHYRRAEELLAGAETHDADGVPLAHPDGTPIVQPEPYLLAAAQVHATLALVSATLGVRP